jgi:hypothetical protein
LPHSQLPTSPGNQRSSTPSATINGPQAHHLRTNYHLHPPQNSPWTPTPQQQPSAIHQQPTLSLSHHPRRQSWHPTPHQLNSPTKPQPTVPTASNLVCLLQPQNHRPPQRSPISQLSPSPTLPTNQSSPSPIRALQHWPRPHMLNIYMALQKVWESASHKFPTQAAVSLASAPFQTHHIYLQNKASSSASMPPNGNKSQLLRPKHRPRDTSGVPTLDIDASPERSTLTRLKPITMANSSTTNGTSTATTANSAGTPPRDA